MDASPLLAIVPVPVLLLGWDGEVRYLNECAERLLGRTADQIVGRAGGQVFPGQGGTELGMAIAAALRDRSAATLQAYVPPAARWMEVEARPMAEGLALFLRDLSVARAVQAELRQSREWASIVYDASSDVMFLMEVEGPGLYRCRSVNASYLAVTGLASEQVVGRRLDEILPEPALSYALAKYAEAIAARDSIRYVEDLMLPAGRVVVETTLKPMYDDGPDGCTLLLGAARDVTARVLAEEGRERLRAQLQQAQKMDAMGRLAGGVAHDFNNLLTAIKCNCELLGDDATLSVQARSDVEEITQTVDRAAALTRQLLAFSRKQELRTRVFDVNGVIANMEQLLRRLTVADVVMVTRLSPEPCLVTADAAQMEQVVVNLVVNARDAMPDGGALTIETLRATLDAPIAHRHGVVPAGRYVVLSVTDSGTGMDDETLSHLFEPFFTTKEVGKGTGLGLSTVYGIVSQCGGHVMARSGPQQGSEFTVYLPESRPA